MVVLPVKSAVIPIAVKHPIFTKEFNGFREFNLIELHTTDTYITKALKTNQSSVYTLNIPLRYQYVNSSILLATNPAFCFKLVLLDMHF
jgi:hypothetical protein